MAEFVISTQNGEEYTIEAPDENAAVKILGEYQSRNYTGNTDANGVPEGMVFDPATNRMVDARALAQQATPGGSLPGTWAKGVPFIGEYADELAGWLTSSGDTANHPNESQPIQTAVARESQKLADENYPKAALVGKVAAGLSALPAAVEFAPAVIPQGSRLATQALVGGAVGAPAAAVEGFMSGYGEGEGDNRLRSAADRAKISAGVGFVAGGAAPVVSKAVGSAAKTVMDSGTVNKALKSLGYNRDAADIVAKTMRADDALGPEGMARMARAGDDAMLVDAGDTSSGLLDAVMQKSGPGGRIARAAVEKRAAAANSHLRGTMDLVLGKPPGMNSAAREIAQKSAAARDAAYKAAYSRPIDYASSAGRQIEGVFSRTPPSILRSAINEANDEMTSQGLRNMQIMANIADDGSVTFRQMPNMMQVDELKKALNKIGAQVDDLGRPIPAAVRAKRLASELRDAAGKAVPEYNTATKLGGDKIAEDNALRLGNKLLHPGTTREEVAEAVDGMSDAERKQLATGLRQYVDDMTANVTQAISNPNMDAREAARALSAMSSRAAQEKLVLALGKQKATPILRSLERVQSALGLKASVATNSKTFARQQVESGIRDLQEGPYNSFLEGKGVDAGRRVWQGATGATPAARQEAEQRVYAEIANILTGRRGADAIEAGRQLMQAFQAGQLNAEASRMIGNYLSGALSVPAYQSGTQALQTAMQ